MLGVLREVQLSSFLATRQLSSSFAMKKNEGGRGEGISSAGTHSTIVAILEHDAREAKSVWVLRAGRRAMLCWALRCDDCDTLLRPDSTAAVAVGSVVATRKQNRDSSRVE
jgi:hypothetical protein